MMLSLSCTRQVSLKVDGQDPGYAKIFNGMNRSFTGVFSGWVQQSGGCQPPLVGSNLRTCAPG
jgi:hypothetical protein